MKIYIKISDYSILKIEKEYPALVGDNYVDTIKLMFDTNPSTAKFYPTLSIQKPTGQKIGSIAFDTATPSFPHTITDDDSNTWYEYDFTLDTTSRKLGVSGSYQATAVINLYNDSEIIIGQRGVNFNFNVLNAVTNQDNSILILGEDAYDVVADLYELMQSLQTSVGGLSNSKANMTDSTQDITAKSLTAETLTATTKVNTPVIDMEADLDNPAIIDINGKHKAFFTEDLMIIFQKAANNFSNFGLVLAEDTFHVVLKDANDTTFGLTLSPSGGFSVFTGSHGFNFDGTKIEINNEELSTKTYVDDNTIGVIEIGTNTGTLTASQLLLLSRPDCIVKNTNTLEYYRKTNTYLNGSYRFEYKTIYIYDNVKYLETKYCTISNAGAWEFGIDDIPFYDRTQADNKFALITETGNKIQLEMNSTTFKIVAKLYDKNNTLLSTSSEIDLPMESVVVSGEYDEATKKVILTLQNGSTIEFSIADLVDGLQAEITSENPLDADLVDDTTATHKFVSAEEKAQITTNATNITALQNGKQNVIDSSHMLSSDLVNPGTHKNKFVRYVNIGYSSPTSISEAKCQEIFGALSYGDVIVLIKQYENNVGYYDEMFRHIKSYWESDADSSTQKETFCGSQHWFEITRTTNQGATSYQVFYSDRDISGLIFENSGRMGVDYNNVQRKLTFDDTPTTSSDNPVKSSGIKSYSDNNLQQAKSYTDSKIEDLKWELGTYDLSVETVNGTTMLLPSPSGTIKATMVEIDGASKVSENLWNEQTETGSLSYSSQTGVVTETSINDRMRSVGYTKVKPNSTYTMVKQQGWYVIYYSADNSSSGIGYDYLSANTNETFTTPATCQYIRITNASSGGATYLHNVSIFEGSDTTRTYEPYYSGIHNLELSGLKVEGANLWSFGDISSAITNTNFSLKANQTYTLNYTPDASISSGVKIEGLDSNGNQVLSKFFTSLPISFTPTADVVKINYYGAVNGTNYMLNYGSTALAYVPYIAPTTLPIDLTSIEDSGGNKLFPNGYMMGNENVKDVLGVYNQESKWNEVVLNGTENNWNMYNTGQFSITLNPAPKSNTPNFKWSPTGIWQNASLNIRPSISIESNLLVFRTTAYDGGSGIDNIADWKAYLQAQPITIQYERATYLTSNTDLSDKLYRQTCYSNGSITLVNTNNQDTTSTFKYLKEVAK